MPKPKKKDTSWGKILRGAARELESSLWNGAQGAVAGIHDGAAREITGIKTIGKKKKPGKDHKR